MALNFKRKILLDTLFVLYSHTGIFSELAFHNEFVSLPPGVGTQNQTAVASAEGTTLPEFNKARFDRQSMKYNTIDSQCKKTHLYDRRRLPEGSVMVSIMRKVFDRVSYVVEHDFEYITYRLVDGNIRTIYEK